MNLTDALLDNPILVKHLRSRLRPMQVAPWVAVVVVAAACAVYAGREAPGFSDAAALKVLLGLQVFILVFVGSSQINASLGGAKESGILDFHRVSPLPPWVVALGFLLGAPVREYLLAAVIVPFAMVSAALIDILNPWQAVSRVARIEVAVLTTTWLVHAVAMLGVLTRKKARSSVMGGIATVVFFLFFVYFGSLGIYFGTTWLMQGEPALNFFGAMTPWLAWVLIYELPLLGFLALAVSRKTGAERAHAYSKPQALACMATLSTLVVGGLYRLAWALPAVPPADWTAADAITLAALYLLSLSAMILAATITPDAGEYVKGVRRAVRAGARRPGPWSDAGSNRLALFAMCVMVLVAARTGVNVIGRPPLSTWGYTGGIVGLVPPQPVSDAAWLASRQDLSSRPIAIGVLTAAYFGLGLQFFSLRTRTSGSVLMGAFLFLAWLAPLLAGAALGMGRADQSLAVTVLALSPIPGVALSTGLGSPEGAEWVRFAALVPPITFAFVFNSFLVVARRRVERLVLAQGKTSARVAVKDDLSVL